MASQNKIPWVALTDLQNIKKTRVSQDLETGNLMDSLANQYKKHMVEIKCGRIKKRPRGRLTI